MQKITGLITTTIGGTIGWDLGAKLDMTWAIILSGIFTIVFWVAGVWLLKRIGLVD